MSEEIVINAIGVQKWFGRLHVLRGVDLIVHRQDIVGIIGPSGSGKSTFLRCINQLESFDRGDIIFRGESVAYHREAGKIFGHKEARLCHLRQRMGMVFQHFNLFPHLTVIDNVMIGPVVVRGEAKESVRERSCRLLDQVGLLAKKDVYPSKLSGGQQQRVAIARALAMEPELMLFDEPTSSLDPELVGEVLAVIRELATSGMTMLIVTHEMGFVRDIAEEVVFMDHGLILERGSCKQVFEQPSNPRTAEFLRSVR